MLKHTTVSIHDLQNGDVIAHYGAMLKLSNRKDHGVWGNHTEETHGAVITFDVELIGDDMGAFPRHWLMSTNPAERYHLQGNRRMTYRKVTEE